MIAALLTAVVTAALRARRRGVAWLLLGFVLAASACVGDRSVKEQTDDTQGRIEAAWKTREDVAALGGPRCGTRELALAEAHREAALGDAKAGDVLALQSNLRTARRSAEVAALEAQACRPPDRDGDGIYDDVDACPDEAEDADGFQDADGCPDTDNDQDGVADNRDRCPGTDADATKTKEDVDRFEDGDGCPDPDNDDDGIADARDACPGTDADHTGTKEDRDGFQDTDGCPEADNDLDGIADRLDKCPNEPESFNGQDDEDGCPDAVAINNYEFIVPTDDKIELKQKIFFDLNSDVIQPKSFPLLAEVANFLLSRPDLRVRIEGHTDNVGPDNKNLDLSRRRAASVRRKLAASGVPDGRMIAEGYGESRPIANNATRTGREKNRRVEFMLLREGE